MMEMNTQLPRFDRQGSSFQEGRAFLPAQNAGLGQVRLRVQGGTFNRPQFVGQPMQVRMAQTQTAPQTTTTTTPVRQPAPSEDTLPPKQDQDVKRHPAMRLAWGRLKKLDAQQLADQLADVIARMRAKGIPPGMVAQIQARLANFAADPKQAATAEVEITEHEVQRMESEILALEEAEAQTSEAPSANWLIAVGAAIGLGLLIDWAAG